MLETLEDLMEMCEYSFDFSTLYHLCVVKGYIHICYKQVYTEEDKHHCKSHKLLGNAKVSHPKEAIRCIHLARDVAACELNHARVLEAYQLLGNTHRHFKDYLEAIKAYKKSLMYAWMLNDQASELKAYQNLALLNFYMGSIEESKRYGDRHESGIYESKTSRVR